jgi:short-subunit dehydrogenase
VKAFLPDMLAKDEGHIVTIGCYSALLGVTGVVDYAASKAASMAFTETLRRELQVRCNAHNILHVHIYISPLKEFCLPHISPS